MVSDDTAPDSHSASRRSFLGTVGLAAGGLAGFTGLAGADRSGDDDRGRGHGHGRGGHGRGKGRGHSDYDDPVLDAIADYAVPVASEGEVHLRDLVPQTNRVAPPGSVGAAARADENAAATVLACKLAQYPVVGLGEATHGTHEFHAIRRRIVQRLVADKGLRVVAFEDQFSNLVDVNDYVVHGEGSVDDAMAAIPAWIWSTEEVRDFLEWLRAFNRGRPRPDRVEVHGIDCQRSDAPASKLLAYLDAVDAEPFDAAATDDESVQDVLETLADSSVREYFYDEEQSIQQDAIDTARAVVEPVRERLQERRDAYVEAEGAYEWTLATRHLRVLEQCLDQLEAELEGYWVGWEARDRAMAENAGWLQETLHSHQVVVWAHNNHVMQGTYQGLGQPMGEFLAETYGEGYYSMGFEFGAGSFTARVPGEAGRQQPTIDAPVSNTASTLDDLRPEEYFLDFGAASRSDAVADWLTDDREIHASGAFFLPDQPAEPIDLAASFDGLTFVSESTPTSIVSESE